MSFFLKKILGLSDQKIYALMRNVACSRDVTNLHKFLIGSQKGKQSEGRSVIGRMVLKMDVEEGGGFGMLLFSPA